MSDKTDAGKDVRENLDSIENDVLNGLMPFQRATVEHIDHLYREGHKRVLVADEVGLGKTMVARGAIAKIARLRHEENDDLVKVVYVCSNGAIAKQNLSKLRIDKDIELADPSNSRLSMQHLQLAKELCDPDLKRRYV
ncbi:MAG: DEAD/DEAH box helicase family protein, partial [Olsenella sp.]